MRQKFLPFIGILFVLVGCAPKMQKPLQICPGKNSTTEALTALQLQSENMVSLFTRKGKFSIEYYEKDEMHKQHFSIQILLIKPPSEIYMQAGTGIIHKALVLGSNEQEFWLQAKPDQIDSYWWGLWSEQNSDTGLMINPGTLLEALGIAEIDTAADWSLSNDGTFDVLTKTVNGVTTKTLYVYCCDYRVWKIEYFDEYGQPSAVVELDDYKEVSEGFFIPFSVVVKSLTENVEETFTLNLTLDSIKPAAQKHIDFPIVRSEPRGFEHVYRVKNGRWIEQQ